MIGALLVFETEIKDGILRMNCLGSIFGFTIEDSDVVMARVIEKLIEEKKIVGLVLAETREYEYDYEQTEMIVEIATAIMKVLVSLRFGEPLSVTEIWIVFTEPASATCGLHV